MMVRCKISEPNIIIEPYKDTSNCMAPSNAGFENITDIGYQVGIIRL
jgi:hypothetical protein